MSGGNLREAVKWTLIVTLIVALWCGVLTARAARGGAPDPPALGATERGTPDEPASAGDLRPVWVIVVFAVRQKRIVGITEFVFSSYASCQDAATEVRQRFGLRLRPVCYLRWMEEEAARGL